MRSMARAAPHAPHAAHIVHAAHAAAGGGGGNGGDGGGCSGGGGSGGGCSCCVVVLVVVVVLLLFLLFAVLACIHYRSNMSLRPPLHVSTFHSRTVVSMFGPDVPDEVIQSNQLWKLRNGKAMGEDGWCEEWLRLLRGLCDESRVDLDNLLRLIGKFAVLPRHHRGSLIKPILKPGKQGHTHNEFRKLSLMSVLRKQVEKLGSILMKPFWTAGAYQGGFKQCKRTTGRIFILLATLSAALWPRTGTESRNYACGLLLVDFEQFFDTLRQERLFHKMQTAGIPDHIIMLWKELVQTHSVKVTSHTTRGESIKVLVGVPQGSGWSPELATLYVDFGLAENLQTIRSGIVVLPGNIPVHLLMYADDLLTANTGNLGLQEQLDIIERTSEEDGLRISYPKIKLN